MVGDSILQWLVSQIEPIIDVLKVFGGGIVAASITLFFSGRRLDRDLHRAARHLSVRLIDIFERYAAECAHVPAENARYQRSDPYDFTGIARLPDLAPLPDDESGWRAIEPRFAIDALTFGARIERGHSVISSEVENGDADDVEAAVERNATSLGRAAWELAAEIRKKYGFEAGDPGWPIEEHFREQAAQFDEFDALRAEQHRCSLEAMTRVAVNVPPKMP